MIEIQEGEVIAGKYRLVERLARGGMGAVWRAQHVTLGVPVAVKFMAARYAEDSQFRARFEREAKAAAQLRSPNVVQIIDYGVEEATPYLVMELLHGEDLGERLAREYRLSVADLLPILTQIGKALRRAHEEGIVHRDLKPANIFLVPQDGELLVKVLDFGIAKWLRPEAGGDVTKTGNVMGSPHYMSPEQVRGTRDVDQRTDLWALGVIVYRALTGHLPFEGIQPVDIGVKIWTERPIFPTVHVPELDPQIDEFMAKALSVDVEKRFQNVKEFMDAAALLPTRRIIVNTLIGLPVEPSEATTRRYQQAAKDEPDPAESRKDEPKATNGTLLVMQEKLVDESPSDAPTTRPFRPKSEELVAKPRFTSGKIFKSVILVAIISIAIFAGFNWFGKKDNDVDNIEEFDGGPTVARWPNEMDMTVPVLEVPNENTSDAGPGIKAHGAPNPVPSAAGASAPIRKQTKKAPQGHTVSESVRKEPEANHTEPRKANESGKSATDGKPRWTTSDE